ncbi:uncharacterized protein RCC_05304 [Ramularia collo-cygni]|uniref:F-box domain-containing protein n=1 Tax=Ramularia collo-cygni TaxID=112498 RepID=A0A2D3VFN5_9PEZI|nr:uncharacterized protein RCC_05304 [Ramularia collo-cygni]CZT19453.1 uncharacterized protein RCC_05304 [Ramularia collo-cygni]
MDGGSVRPSPAPHLFQLETSLPHSHSRIDCIELLVESGRFRGNGTMSTPTSMRALQEPAILYLILSQLSQQELLRVQMVCQTWNRLISTDSRLLTIMWLHPGIPPTHVEEATTQVNPLLLKTFPYIFETCNFEDYFTVFPTWEDTPFRDMWVRRSPALLPILKHPAASWRRMLPINPPPDQLLVNVSGEGKGGGKFLRLNFSNQNTQDMRPSHPSWLTFGMLYDIVECAWYQAKPWRLHCVKFDFPSASLTERPHREWIPQDAVISDELRASARSRAGLVRIELEPDTRSEFERSKLHAEVIAERERSQKRHERYGFCGTTFKIRGEIFTTEFHFADALSLDEIAWDEVHEYDRPSVEVPPAPPSPPQRRFLGIRIGRRR